MTRIAASLQDAFIESIGLFANIACLGFVAAFAPKFLFSSTASLLFWGAAIISIVYLIYNSISNLRTLQFAVQEHGLQLSSAWIKTTTTIAVLVGITLGSGYARLFLDPELTPYMRYGMIAAAIVALALLSYFLARILIHPRAIRPA